jgi:hypothetical protein
MSYCTLEEAWGPDFKKQKKKSKKEKKLEKEEQQMLKESIDPQIVIPETHRMADYRKDVLQHPMSLPDAGSISPYDDSFDSYVSPYQRYTTDEVRRSNEAVLSTNQIAAVEQPSPYVSEIEKPVDDMIHLTKDQYHKLKDTVVEGFANQTDEQFNQLILYIFTGLFYLLMLDMMYQLGKKSY